MLVDCFIPPKMLKMNILPAIGRNIQQISLKYTTDNDVFDQFANNVG